MNMIRRVFRYEFVRHFKRRSYVFISFGLPLLAIVAYFLITGLNNVPRTTPGARLTPPAGSNAPEPTSPAFLGLSINMGIIDQAGVFPAGFRTSPFTQYPNADAANDAIHSGKITSYYVIPPDYLKSGHIEAWMVSFSLNNTAENTVRTVLSRALAAQVGSLSPSEVTLLGLRNPTITTYRTEQGSGAVSDNQFLANVGLMFGFALAFLVGAFFSSSLLMQSVVEERENRVVEILISSMRPSQLLIGKVLSLGLLGLIQIAAWGAAIVFIVTRLAAIVPGAAGLSVTPTQLVVVFAYYILGYLMFAAVYAGIGSIANNMREGPQLAVFFTLPAMLPLYLITLFSLAPDGPLPTFLSIFPISAPLAMVMRIAIYPVPTWQILLSLSLLALTAFGFMWFAGRVFRLVIMLAGQPPKPRDLIRLVREGRS